MTVGVVAGVMVRTSGFLERRFELYMRTGTAEGLSPDTRVYLQGLAVGRLAQVNPSMDTATNRLRFVASLYLRRAFPDGSPLRLPVGTRGMIAQPTGFVGAYLIQLELPTGQPAAEFLQPGDTIESRRVESVVNMLGEVATRLTDELTVSLERTRDLMQRASGAVDASTALLRTAGPEVDAVLQQLARSLDHTDSLLRALEPQVGMIADTLLATLSDTRVTLARVDTLTSTAQGIALDNRAAIAETMQRLQRAAVILQHFSDQMSRRPLRLLTGVTPPADSTEHEP